MHMDGIMDTTTEYEEYDSISLESHESQQDNLSNFQRRLVPVSLSILNFIKSNIKKLKFFYY